MKILLRFRIATFYYKKMNENRIPMIDSHAHIHDSRFNEDRDDVITRAQEAKMSHIVTIGTNRETSRQAIACAQRYDIVYAAIGMHPLHTFDAYDCDPDEQGVEECDYDVYKALAQQEKVVAIGEVGLDYHHFGPQHDVAAIKQKQRDVLMTFIELCNDVHKPIIVHCWDGYDDLLDILMQCPVEKKGIIHSYVGSWKNAIKFVDLGYKIGLNGIVTYGESYDTLLKKIDLTHLVIETDCPYLPPRPLPRDGRCEPRDVLHVAQKIADAKEVAIERVLRETTRTAQTIFGV